MSNNGPRGSDVMRSVFRKRKQGETLTEGERYEEQQYQRQRRRRRIEVVLDSEDAVADVKRRARDAGVTTPGAWVALVIRQRLADEAQLSGEVVRLRKEIAEARVENALLKKRLELLSTAIRGGEPGLT